MKMVGYLVSVVAIMAVLISNGMQCLADCGVNKVSNGFRIFNGKDATRCQFPWMVSLIAVSYSRRRYTNCGASIIDSKHILTGAVCVYDWKMRRVLQPSNIHVRSGSMNQSQAIARTVEKVFINPYYDVYQHRKDIAILRLKDALKFDECQSPICLTGNTTITPGRKCLVMGWGRTKTASVHYSAQLKWQEEPIASTTECQNVYGKLWDKYTLCGTVPSFCMGDAGVPLACLDDSDNKYYHYGIASVRLNSTDCMGSGKYTFTPSFKDWIDKTIQHP